MGAGHGARLVRRGRAGRGDLFGYRRLAPCWPAGPAHPPSPASRRRSLRDRIDALGIDGCCCATRRDASTHRPCFCSDPARDPLQIIRWFVWRWQVEVTFREVRDHLGVETQRPWSDRAIARTTPCLLALFSIVILLAARLDRRARSTVCTDAWYRKPRPTFADTLAAVRRQFWREQGLLLSGRPSEVRKLRPGLRRGITYALCHAA